MPGFFFSDTLPLSDTSLPAHSSKVLSLPDLKRKRFLPTPRIPTASATMDKTGALQSEDGTKIDICVPGNTPKITRQPSKHGSHIAGSKNDHSEDKWQCSAPEKPAMLDEGSASACKRASQDVAASAKEICPNTKVMSGNFLSCSCLAVCLKPVDDVFDIFCIASATE